MKKMLIFSALSILICQCASTTKSIAGNTSIQPHQQDSEKANANHFRKDLSRRIAKFGKEIKREVDSGELQLKIDPLSEMVEHLNATYLPSIRTESAEITIQCQPGYKECFTDAFEHEVGHHIYHSLTDEQKEKIFEAINHRLNQPDAKAFQDEIAQIESRYVKLHEILRNNITPINECNLLTSDLAFGEALQKKLSKAGVVFSPEKIEQIHEKEKQYRNSLPGCTAEKLRQAQAELSQIKAAIDILFAQIRQIYHQKVSITDKELPDPIVNAAFSSLKQIDPKGLREFHQAGEEYFQVIESIAMTAMTKERSAEESAAGEAAMEAVTKIVLYSINRDSSLIDSIINSFQLASGGHDSGTGEQFAAAVDSLADGYTGPIVTAPMKMRLDEPLLQALEQLEYKGQHVLAPLVMEYRQKLK